MDRNRQSLAKPNSQVVHKSYPEPVDRTCGQMSGQLVENRGTTSGKRGRTSALSTFARLACTTAPQGLCIRKGPWAGVTTLSPPSTAPITTTFL